MKYVSNFCFILSNCLTFYFLNVFPSTTPKLNGPYNDSIRFIDHLNRSFFHDLFNIPLISYNNYEQSRVKKGSLQFDVDFYKHILPNFFLLRFLPEDTGVVSHISWAPIRSNSTKLFVALLVFFVSKVSNYSDSSL